jgi:hypothetical protein
MSVTELASRRRDDRAKELALWRAYAGLYVELCGDDPKALGRLWEDYVRDMPEEISARRMLGEL